MRINAYDRYCKQNPSESPTTALGKSEHPLAVDVWINAINLQVELHLRNLYAHLLEAAIWSLSSEAIRQLWTYFPGTCSPKSNTMSPVGKPWSPRRLLQSSGAGPLQDVRISAIFPACPLCVPSERVSELRLNAHAGVFERSAAGYSTDRFSDCKPLFHCIFQTPAPIHESPLRLGYFPGQARAERWWSSDRADWKSVVVTWSGRRWYPRHCMKRLLLKRRIIPRTNMALSLRTRQRSSLCETSRR